MVVLEFDVKLRVAFLFVFSIQSKRNKPITNFFKNQGHKKVAVYCLI